MKPNVQQNKLTKQDFDKLYSDSITKKEYDRIINLINDVFYKVMKKLCPKLDWVDFDNAAYDCDGYFDPESYKEDISYTGCLCDLPEPFEYSIPTRWLWEEDFKDQFNAKVRLVKEKEKARIEKEREKSEKQRLENQKTWDSIKSKLNKKEMDYLLNKFKTLRSAKD